MIISCYVYVLYVCYVGLLYFRYGARVYRKGNTDVTPGDIVTGKAICLGYAPVCNWYVVYA